MPSLFTHAVVSLALGQAGKPEWRQDPRFWAAAIAASALPDADVVGFALGVRYGDLWGHRGMTHSLLFAAVTAALLTAFFPGKGSQRWKLGLLFFLIAASHGALDALTDGGLGVAFFSPFAADRYFFSWTPIHVSPIGLTAFFSTRGMRVLRSEVVWVWIPTLVVCGAVWAKRWWRGGGPR